MAEPARSDPAPQPAVLLEDRLDYTPQARSVGLARRRAARLVTEWGHAALAGDAALVVSELMTNALLHGSRHDRLIRVRIALSADALRVEVTDPRGERLPEPRTAEGEDQFGRGLLLVGALSDRWRCEPCAAGKTVYAEWNVGRADRGGAGELVRMTGR
ncbi:ATP-binding protein [Streptomyces sp. Je 1-369]|uniref:ATP-binding protein n=1 Tax=Streptomyces sp. Je 1-369 TaxID=2966192 RepID=UPI0022864070|nr:ATP-binding protein [Streptomyces sp. Je 1-369]WAL95550.1 ATP-binding protein [Streptomyces sp. Je 1-369]